MTEQETITQIAVIVRDMEKALDHYSRGLPRNLTHDDIRLTCCSATLIWMFGPRKLPDLSQGLAEVSEAPLCPVLPPLESFVCGPWPACHALGVQGIRVGGQYPAADNPASTFG